MSESFKSYLELRDEIDQLSEKLEKSHRKHMLCKAGCDMCCMDYSVFPLEFYSILDALRNKEQKPEMITPGTDADCIFLKEHKCMIYEERPVICRTHGLPLLYANEEGEWELSACELNFTQFPFEEFSEKNTFPQDKFNSRLFVLNKAFLNEFKEKEYDVFDLIPLKKLKDHL